MPSFIDIPPHKTPAESVDVQQVIDALSGRRNTPIAFTVNDPIAYALTVKNTDPGGRGLVILAADSTTVLLSIDANGVRVSPDGTAAVPPLTSVGPGAAQVAEGDHVHGVGGYAGVGAVTLETLYASSTVVTAINYTVASGVLFVFCTLGVTVTLPSALTTNRPITVTAIAGTTIVGSSLGAVVGGSTNTTTGAVMNGVVAVGDSMTFKADGTSWRVV